MIMAGMQSATQTNVITNAFGSLTYAIAKATNKDDADKAKQIAEMVTGILVSLLTLAATMGTGAAVAEGANAVATAADETARIAKDASLATRLFSRFQEFGTRAMGQRFFQMLNILISLEQMATGVSAGGYEMAQGFLERDMAHYQGDTILNNIAMSMNNDEMRSSQQFIAQREKGFKTSNRAIGNVMKGFEAFAKLLCSSMV